MTGPRIPRTPSLPAIPFHLPPAPRERTRAARFGEMHRVSAKHIETHTTYVRRTDDAVPSVLDMIGGDA